MTPGGLASWEPDFWSAIRNATRVELYRAEERAADYGLARLSLQAEIAANYFTLRGYDAQVAIYTQSIDLYKRSLDLVKTQFAGAIASALDVARVESLLFSTETKLAQVQGQRQVTEQSIAILVNMAPASFTIKPVDEIRVANFTIPQTIPSTLLERRPDIAGMERQMAQANRVIGIARAAFFPDVRFSARRRVRRCRLQSDQARQRVSGPMAPRFRCRSFRVGIAAPNCSRPGRPIARRKIDTVRRCSTPFAKSRTI